MNYGLWVSASGMFASMFRQDVAANNMANVNTAGFKPEMVSMRWRDPERIEDQLATDPKVLLEGLGGGLLVAPVHTNWDKQGNLWQTGNDLDVAIQGEGFLTFTTERGSGQERLRLGRDGRLTLNQEGYLVHAGTSMKVVGEGGETIQLGPDPVTIHEDGSIEQNGAIVARIALVRAPAAGLRKAGSNMLCVAEGVEPTAATGRLRQGSVEGSAVDPIQALMEVTNATSAASSNARMVRIFDETLDAAINRFGRVA